MELMNTKEALSLIDKIIEEHKVILQGLQDVERIANDARVLTALEGAKEQFMPGRPDQVKALQKLAESHEIIDKGLKSHFAREESGLLPVVEKWHKELESALRSLLLEHEDLRNRFAQTKGHIAKLTGGALSRHLWEASAHDMRAYISHTRKLLAAHANIEQELLQALRSKLKEAKE